MFDESEFTGELTVHSLESTLEYLTAIINSFHIARRED